MAAIRTNGGKFGKPITGEGKPDPRVFSVEDPQPDPHHDVDPARLDFSKPQPKQGQRLKHTALDIEKQIQEREETRARMADMGVADEDFMLAQNPMEELVDKHRIPGMAYGFMSDSCEGRLGKRGWVPVKDEKGDVEKLGTLKLVMRPQHLVEEKQRQAAKESEQTVKDLRDEYTESVNRLKVEGRDLGLRVLAPGEMSGDFTNTETGKTVTIG